MADGISPPADGRRIGPAADQYVLSVRLPGVNKDDIMVAFLDGCVEVRGLARTQWEESVCGVHYFESEEMAAYHRVPLPRDADVVHALVTFEDGGVQVVIPRKPGLPAD